MLKTMTLANLFRRYVTWCSCSDLPISETNSEFSFSEPTPLLRDWDVVPSAGEQFGEGFVSGLAPSSASSVNKPDIIRTRTDASAEYLYRRPISPQTSSQLAIERESGVSGYYAKSSTFPCTVGHHRGRNTHQEYDSVGKSYQHSRQPRQYSYEALTQESWDSRTYYGSIGESCVLHAG